MGHGEKRWNIVRNSFAAGEIKKHSLKRNVEPADVSEIVITIRNYAEGAPLLPSTKPRSSIYRVPKNMRLVHQSAYCPKLVSIGPFHHKERHLQFMEHKLRFLNRLLGSTRTQNGTTAEINSLAEEVGQQYVVGKSSQSSRDAVIETLALAMKTMEPKARECYSEIFEEIDSNNFVLMMIRDGCFVIELLRLYAKCHKEFVDDPIFTTRWMMPILQRDFLMLENQLPFSVLQKLFDLTSSGQEATLAELTLKFFDPLMPREKKMKEKLKLDGNHYHLLGLFRSSFLSSFKDKQPHPSKAIPLVQKEGQSVHCSNELKEIELAPVQERQINPSAVKVKETAVSPVQERQLINSVTELKEAGVKFKKRQNHDLLDIEFNEGVLEIPPLLIDDHTGPVFLNFVAYEQCDQLADPYFTHYVLFFDSLVNSHKDVELLHYNGIVNHVLGSDEDVAELFNKLCKEVVYDLDNLYLSRQLRDVNRYYGTTWHMWRAKWKHDYFSSPWAFSSLLAAMFLLLLTLIQTFFSVFSYFHPPS